MSSLPTTPEVEASPGRPSNSLVFKVGEMSGKLDQLLLQVGPALASLSMRVDKVEEVQATFIPRSELTEEFRRRDLRIEALEASKWMVLGMASIGGVLVWVLQNAPGIIHLFQVSTS